MCAALLGLGLNATLSPAAMSRWGWRVLLLAGCAIIPLLHRLCGSLEETDEFLATPTPHHHPGRAERVGCQRYLVVIGTMMVTMTTVSFT